MTGRDAPSTGSDSPDQAAVAADTAAGDELVIDLTDGARLAGTAGGIDLWADEYRTPEYLAWAIDDLRREFGDPEQRFGVYFIDGQDPRSSLGRAVELERFGDSFDNDVPLMRELYGEFEDIGETVFITVVDHQEHLPCGNIRTVRNTASHGCRILNDLQKTGENGWGLTWDEILARSDFAAESPEEILDVPTVSVAVKYQGARQADGVSKALYAGLMQQGVRGNYKTWVCSLDRIPYILVQAAAHDIMHEFDGVPGQPYYGAPDTVPLWANVWDYEYYLRKNFPESYAMYAYSVGLEDRYFFGFAEPASWVAPDPEVIDLRRYDPVLESR
jgi:hypothetical protein